MVLSCIAARSPLPKEKRRKSIWTLNLLNPSILRFTFATISSILRYVCVSWFYLDGIDEGDGVIGLE